MFFDFVIDGEWMDFSRIRLVCFDFRAAGFGGWFVYSIDFLASTEAGGGCGRRGWKTGSHCDASGIGRTEFAVLTHGFLRWHHSRVGFGSCVRSAGVQMEWRLCG